MVIAASPQPQSGKGSASHFPMKHQAKVARKPDKKVLQVERVQKAMLWEQKTRNILHNLT
jgi:hypothetical protein